MKIKDIITESSSMQDDVASALPMTYVVPKLQNQDPYKQYRFGVAIAKAKGQSHSDQNYAASTPWGENLVVVGFGNTVDDYIDDALAEIGLTSADKKMITTPKSEESKSVGKTSPVAKPKKNKYGI